jgi:hypothetical protein
MLDAQKENLPNVRPSARKSKVALPIFDVQKTKNKKSSGSQNKKTLADTMGERKREAYNHLTTPCFLAKVSRNCSATK